MPKRRRPRGTIEERGGALRVAVYAGIDPITKRRYYLRETVPADHPNKDAKAQDVLEELRAKVAEKRHPRTSATVNQLMDRYLERIQVEPTTWNRYEECVRLHIKPLLGAEPVAD